MTKYTLTYGVIGTINGYYKNSNVIEGNFYNRREAKRAYKLLKILLKKEKEKIIFSDGNIKFITLLKNGRIIKKYSM